MTAPSVLVTQFLSTFVFHALRNDFWKWGEDKWEESANSLDLWFKICVSYQTRRKVLQGKVPHPELTEEVMSVFAALYLIFLRKHIVNKREKLEFGSERRRRAAVVGLASLS